MSAYQLAAGQSLHTFFKQLDMLTVQQKMGLDVYRKGLDYFENDAVEELDAEDGNNVRAVVFGSEEYDVHIFSRLGNIAAECSCPYGREWGGMCKHIAATLIQAMEDELWKNIPEVAQTIHNEAVAPKPKATDIFEEWVQSLSTEELRQTVRKLANASFRQEIALKFSSNDHRNKVFLETKKQIEQLISGKGRSHNFDDKLTAQLEKLKGVWTVNPLEVKNLFLKIIKAVEKLTDNGWFYDDEDYYDECGYDGTVVAEAMVLFLKDLNDEQRQAFSIEFWEAAKKENYSSFDALFSFPLDYLKPSDWPFFQKKLLNEEVNFSAGFEEILYAFFEPEINMDDKEAWLKILSKESNPFKVKRALFYEKDKNDPAKAVKILDKAIAKSMESKPEWWSPGEDFKPVFEERIRLAQAQNEPLETLAKQYVSIMRNADALYRSIALAPALKDALEDILKKRGRSQYLQFLEKERRLDEVVEIIDNKNKLPFSPYIDGVSGGFARYDFYVRNKKELPEKALACFKERLADELPHTGEKHYFAVVDALRNIKTLIPKHAFDKQVEAIKSMYYRRTNLITKLNAAFKS